MKDIEVETVTAPIHQVSKDSNNKIKRAKFNVLMKKITNTIATLTTTDFKTKNPTTITGTLSPELKANVKFQVRQVSILNW